MRYQRALHKVLVKLKRFRPRYLIVAFGLDTAKDDPTGTWSLVAEDYTAIGKLIGALHYPTLIVQEGGYDTRVLGINARHFFEGLWAATYSDNS